MFWGFFNLLFLSLFFFFLIGSVTAPLHALTDQASASAGTDLIIIDFFRNQFTAKSVEAEKLLRYGNYPSRTQILVCIFFLLFFPLTRWLQLTAGLNPVNKVSVQAGQSMV